MKHSLAWIKINYMHAVRTVEEGLEAENVTLLSVVCCFQTLNGGPLVAASAEWSGREPCISGSVWDRSHWGSNCHLVCGWLPQETLQTVQNTTGRYFTGGV